MRNIQWGQSRSLHDCAAPMHAERYSFLIGIGQTNAKQFNGILRYALLDKHSSVRLGLRVQDFRRSTAGCGRLQARPSAPIPLDSTARRRTACSQPRRRAPRRRPLAQRRRKLSRDRPASVRKNVGLSQTAAPTIPINTSKIDHLTSRARMRDRARSKTRTSVVILNPLSGTDDLYLLARPCGRI